MAVLPVEALSAAGVIVGLGYGFRWLFKEWQEFRNDGKVDIFLSVIAYSCSPNVLAWMPGIEE